MKRNGQLLRGARSIFLNGLLFRNPVLVGALGLYPLVAAARSVGSAAALSLLFLLLALPCGLILCFFGMLAPRWFRPGLVLLVSAACYPAAAALADLLLPGSVSGLGMAAGLMICNSAVYSRAEEYAPEHVAAAVLADAFGCSLGFAGVAFLLGALRGLWLTGSLPGAVLPPAGKGFDLPFAGFLMLGFLAALLQWLNRRRAERAAERLKRRIP